MGLSVSDGFLMGRPPWALEGLARRVVETGRLCSLAIILEEWLSLVVSRSRSKHLADHSR